MKKIGVLLVMLGSLLMAKAADYNYLVLQTNSGETIDLSASGLTITFQDGNLVASNGTTVPLSTLAKMFFSEEATGIKELLAEVGNAEVGVYSVSGTFMGTYKDLATAKGTLRPGVYVMKTAGKTFKTAIK